MSGLRSRLRELAQREATFSDVRSECIRIASGDAKALAQARRELKKALASGTLTSEQFETLERAIERVVVADGGTIDSIPDAADRTDIGLVRGKPISATTLADDDDTVVQHESVDTDDSQEAPTLDSGVFDDEETVIRPRSTLAEADPEATFVGSETPTLSYESDADIDEANENTVLSPRKLAQPDMDANSAFASTPTLLPSDDDDDPTVLSTNTSSTHSSLTPDDDKAAVLSPRGSVHDPDATVLLHGEPTSAHGIGDATVVDSGDTDLTRILGPGDADIRDPDAMATADHSFTDTNTRYDTWDPAAPTRRGPVVDRVFASGSVLKERFRLTEPLGEGGMGTVWKSVDILKLEAEDRNPYVAIKLLQGDFKAHPEAFIALQRESSKQQRLAHPNIATVFDFDREASSNTVFMTMEVMNGSDLADFIKTLPNGGLPYAEAMDLIEQLGAGLDYAHKAGLVHSDLKPGNCFLTNDGKVKLLDFGIARASATRDDAEGEETKFDPGQLGALTPSYATLEMFKGLEPDPRDDIYAMAIIAHQLLTGKHPYNRRGAPTAMKEGLQVAPLDKLTKRQNRALVSGLAFERENRTGSVGEFLDGMRVKKLNKALIALPIVLVLAVVGVGYAPLMNYLAQSERTAIIEAMDPAQAPTIATLIQSAQALADAGKLEQRDLILLDVSVIDAVITQFERDGEAGVVRGLELAAQYPQELRGALLAHDRVTGAVIAMIQTGDETKIKQGLALAEKFPPDIAKDIRQDRRTEDAIFSLYEGRLSTAFGPASQHYDIAGALAQVASLKQIYPGLARTRDVADALSASRDQEVERLGGELTELLAGGQLLPDSNSADVGDVLELVARLNPASEVLVDARIAQTYTQAANEAIANERYERAERVLSAGLRFAPSDEGLKRLNNDVLAELKRIQDERLATDIESRLGPMRAEFKQLEDFAPVRDDLQRLAEVAPASPLLRDFREQLNGYFEQSLGTRVAAKNWLGAQQLLSDYAGLIDLVTLQAVQRQLYRAAGAASAVLPASSTAAVAAQQELLAALLVNPESTRSWDSALAIRFKELLVLLPPADPRISQARDRIAEVSSAQAEKLVAADNYTGAADVLERATLYHPTWAGLSEARTRLERAKTEFEQAQAEQARLARINDLKSTILSQAVANEPDAALEALQQLRTELPQNDAFVSDSGPLAIGQSYARLAAIVAGAKDYEVALQLAERGLGVAPELNQLAQSRDNFLAELDTRALAAQIVQPPGFRMATARAAEHGNVATDIPTEVTPNWRVLAEPGSPREPMPLLPGVVSDGTRQLATNTTAVGRLMPPASSALETRIATSVAAKMQAQLDYRPESIRDARSPLQSFSTLYPAQAGALREALAQKFAAGLSARISESPDAAAELIDPVATYALIFPGAALAVEQRLAKDFTALLRNQAQTNPDLAKLRMSVEAFRKLLPKHASTMSAAVSTPVIRSVVETARVNSLHPERLRASVQTYTRLFPETNDVFQAQLSAALLDGLADAVANDRQLEAIPAAVDAFRVLLPQSATGLLSRLKPTFDAALADATRADPTLLSLETALQRFRSMFADAPAEQERGLVQVAVASVASLVATDLQPGAQPYAHLKAPVERFERLFPQHLAALRRALGARLLGALKQLSAATAADTEQLRPGLDAATRLLGADAVGLRKELAPNVAADIARSAVSSPGDLSSALQSISNYRDMFGGSEAPLRDALVPSTSTSLVGIARANAMSPDVLGSAVSAFRQAFSQDSQALDERLVAVSIGAMRAAVAAKPSSPAAFADVIQSYREIFPTAIGEFDGALAPILEDALERAARAQPHAFADLAAPLAEFSKIFPGRIAALRARGAVPVIAALQTKSRQNKQSLTDVAADITAFQAVFPGQAPTLRSRIAGGIGESVLAQLEAAPDDITGAAVQVGAYGTLFPDHVDALRSDVAQSMWTEIAARADKNINDLSLITGPLADYRAAFPKIYESVSGALITRIARSLQRNARDTRVPLAQVASQLEQFRGLFPSEHGQVVNDVAKSLAERIAESKVETAAQVKALGGALSELKRLFPQRHADVSDGLGAKILANVRALQGTDPVAASALQREGLKVFAANRELASIRIELPLQEVIDGRALLKSAKLSNAHDKLAIAVKRDPQHSAIAPFRVELTRRMDQATAAYKKYLKIVKTNPKASEHAKAWRRARSLWVDNKEFKELTPPAPYACTVAKAGLGERRTCYDRIGKRARDRGPSMIVMPAGGRVSAPFAITKYEVSVKDYGEFCKRSKRCKTPRLKRTLPVHNLSLADMQGYAKWLSKVTRASYRLPTSVEWVHAAGAGGKQPRKDFNCAVVVGGKQLKGLSLLSVRSGSQNGWGMLNYIGNVRELVRDGSTILARGGSFKDKLQNCSIDLSVAHNGNADKHTGFRLVREIN